MSSYVDPFAAQLEDADRRLWDRLADDTARAATSTAARKRDVSDKPPRAQLLAALQERYAVFYLRLFVMLAVVFPVFTFMAGPRTLTSAGINLAGGLVVLAIGRWYSGRWRKASAKNRANAII